MVRALDFYPGDPGSNPSWTCDFFQTMHHFLVANFHIRKMGALRDSPIESNSHKNEILLIINDYSLKIGVCYVPFHHSFIRDYLPWLEGRVGRSHGA